MRYPQDFPKDFRRPVDKAIAEAEVELSRTGRRPAPISLVRTPYDLPPWIRTYVDHIYFEFGRQICAVVRQRTFDGEKARALMDEFLHTIATEVFFNVSGGGTTESFGTFEDRLKREIRDCEEWVVFQRGLVDALTPTSLRGDPQIETLAEGSRPTLGAQIKALREECRMTTEQLAEATKLSVRNVRRHERGETKAIRPGNIQSYEDAFTKRLKRKITLTSSPRPVIDQTSS